MRALALIAALLCGQPLLADTAASDADVAALVGVIEARGCVLPDKNDETVLADSSLTTDQARAAVARLIAEGKATIIDDQLHLLTGACAPAGGTADPDAVTRAAKTAPPPNRDSFIALIEAHGCRMTENEASQFLPSAGFTQDMTRTIVDDLTADGLATVDETGLTLKTGNCL